MDEHPDEPSRSPPRSGQPPRGRARVTAGAALVAVVVAPALLIASWSRAVPAPPRELPPLILDAAEVRAQLEADAREASDAPEGEGAAERRRLYRELNVAEHEGRDPPGRAEDRRARLRAALARLVDEHGESTPARVRAADLALLEPALRGALPSGERVAELGGFVRMMERYDLARGGRQLAPRIVVRALFKARWNAIHGRELTEGLSAVERHAYWGWLAYGATAAPVERRLEALDRLGEAEGLSTAEARGVILFDAGRLTEAREAFERAWEDRPSFRLRNHALACE